MRHHLAVALTPLQEISFNPVVSMVVMSVRQASFSIPLTE